MDRDCGVLKCIPEEVLDFNVTGGNQSHVVLQLENTSDSFLAFKIKTTAPKSYLVKPSSGVIKPCSKQDVNILLIPLFEPPKESVPDRFLIQSTVVKNDRALTKEEWLELANEKDRNRLQERRLNVNFNWLGLGGGGQPSKSLVDSLDIIPSAEADISEKLHGIIGRVAAQDFSELKKQYEELVAFCVAVEKQKKEIELELDDLRRKTQVGGGGGPRLSGVKGNPALEYWQVGLLVLAVVSALKIVKFL